MFYITTPAESDIYVLLTEAEAEIAKVTSQLDALLIGLEVKEIDELKTKSPEYFSKLAECIADNSQEKSAEIAALCDQLDGTPHSYIRQLKERIEGHIEENQALRERQRVLVEALKDAIGAGEYVVKIIEADANAGASPSIVERSMPHATLAHCYAAMNFLNKARAALVEKEG